MILHIPGIPVPQGSKKSIPHVASGQFVMVDANPNLKAWRRTITTAAREHAGTFKAHEPVMVILRLQVPRPRTVKRQYPAVRPDIDKLERAILDSLTDAGVWADDGQVVTLHTDKRYGEPGVDIECVSLEVPF